MEFQYCHLYSDEKLTTLCSTGDVISLCIFEFFEVLSVEYAFVACLVCADTP